MTGRRFLLLHVTISSGHHHASRAIAHALRRIDPFCQVINVDAFDYTSPFVRSAIHRSYFSVIRHQPNVWEYLYDNPAVHQRVQRFRTLLHRYHTAKLARLLETVQPHAVACTQAFPCGMIADFKQQHGLRVPLVGVLTDFAPHVYWLHDTVDAYIVAAEELRDRFVANGVAAERIQVSGIPVEPKFLDPVDRPAVYREFDLDPQVPVVLIMGGGGGFGPIPELMASIDRMPDACQFVVIAGTNQPLLAWLRAQRFTHRVRVHGYIDAVPQLMDIATLIITKPGGLTTSEALAKRLPLLILSPIPGQEMCNARYLLAQRAAEQLESPERAGEVVGELLRDRSRLDAVRRASERLSHPTSAMDAAQLMIELADRYAERPNLLFGDDRGGTIHAAEAPRRAPRRHACSPKKSPKRGSAEGEVSQRAGAATGS